MGCFGLKEKKQFENSLWEVSANTTTLSVLSVCRGRLKSVKNINVHVRHKPFIPSTLQFIQITQKKKKSSNLLPFWRISIACVKHSAALAYLPSLNSCVPSSWALITSVGNSGCFSICSLSAGSEFSLSIVTNLLLESSFCVTSVGSLFGSLMQLSPFKFSTVSVSFSQSISTIFNLLPFVLAEGASSLTELWMFVEVVSTSVDLFFRFFASSDFPGLVGPLFLLIIHTIKQ